MSARLFLAAALWLLAAAAQAHEPFEITTNVRLFADRTLMEVLIADSTAGKLCLPGAPKLDAGQFAKHRAQLTQCGAALFVLRDAQGPLAPRTVEVVLTPENDLAVTLDYPAPAGPTLGFVATHLQRLADANYGASLTVTGDRVFLGQKLLRADDDAFEVSVPGGGAAATAPAAASPAAFLRLGVEHILSGYDHLLFLAGLLLVCQRWRSALLIVTAFTLAHSLTLALAGLGVITPPSRLVEAAIAATIVFVGLDNLVRGRGGAEPPARWLLTFVFGLLHGLGFASALVAIGLPRGVQSVLPLLSFNLGVELGQLAVAAIALPLLFRLRRHRFFTARVVPALSVLVAGAGLWWLVERSVL